MLLAEGLNGQQGHRAEFVAASTPSLYAPQVSQGSQPQAHVPGECGKGAESHLRVLTAYNPCAR